MRVWHGSRWRWAGLVLLLAGSAHAEAWRVCVERVVVAPAKLNGQPWDGPGRSAKQAAEALHLVAETEEEKALTTVAPAALEVLEQGAAPPDLAVVLRAGGAVVLTTDPRADGETAIWPAGTLHCATVDRAALLGAVEVEVIDRDLRDDDLVGKRSLSSGLPVAALAAHRWDGGAFGAVLALEISLTPVAATELRRGELQIPAGALSRVEVVVPGPGTLLLDWTVVGRLAGLEGAHDDTLLGYSLHAPDGRPVDTLKKHTVGQRRVPVSVAGAYGVVFSNDGLLRSSARWVKYQVRFEGR